VKQAVEVLVYVFTVTVYFAQRPIFEHSASGVGNLPSHVYETIYYTVFFPRTLLSIR